MLSIRTKHFLCFAVVVSLFLCPILINSRKSGRKKRINIPCMCKYPSKVRNIYILKTTVADLGYWHNLLFISKQIVCAVTFLCNTGNITDVISWSARAPSGLFSLSHRTKMVSCNVGTQKSCNICLNKNFSDSD